MSHKDSAIKSSTMQALTTDSGSNEPRQPLQGWEAKHVSSTGKGQRWSWRDSPPVLPGLLFTENAVAKLSSFSLHLDPSNSSLYITSVALKLLVPGDKQDRWCTTSRQRSLTHPRFFTWERRKSRVSLAGCRPYLMLNREDEDLIKFGWDEDVW